MQTLEGEGKIALVDGQQRFQRIVLRCDFDTNLQRSMITGFIFVSSLLSPMLG